MQLTDKHRKLAWIGGSLVALYFFGPWVINTVRSLHSQPTIDATSAKPSPVHVAPPPPPAPIDPLSLLSPADRQAAKLAGNYAGSGVLLDRGACRVGLQIVPVLAKPTEFTGYSTTACNSAFAWVGKKIDKEHAAKQAIDSMTPTSVIMSGVVKDGVLQFTVTKSIGTPSGGCPLTAFTITPYAGTQVAAEWKAGTCDGGQMILNRV